jgi:hypothetical protein
MGLVDVSGERRVPRRKRRTMTAVVVMAAVVIAGVTVVLLTGVGRQPACPAATNPLNGVQTTMAQPRLCVLGAPSQLIGSGRLHGVSWRAVVTPPRSWSAYAAAGFQLPGDMQGPEGSCFVEVASTANGSVEYGCETWDYVDVPGKFLTSACDDFGTVYICYAGMQGQADHFVMAPPGGGEFTVRSVPFRGDSFVAFAVPAGEQAGVLTAYDHRGRSMDSTSLS